MEVWTRTQYKANFCRNICGFEQFQACFEFQVHAYIIAELRKQMPSMIGKEKKKKELIQNLDKIFEQLQVSIHFRFCL